MPFSIRHRRYVTAVDYDTEARLLHGRAMIARDVLDFHGRNIVELRRAFRETLEDYAAWRRVDRDDVKDRFARRKLTRS